MSTLLIEPFGGMAGDMLLAALLDLGDPRFTLADLQALAARLVPGECRLNRTEVRRGGLAATHLEVVTDESLRPPARHLSQLLELIAQAELGAAAEERAGRVLRRLAAAESRVHGIGIERVHFHEVGAVDTLIDVGGACLALERLGVERVVATPPLLGEGTFHCEHGELPVPAPGTLALLEGVPHRRGGGSFERLTPTGAALLAECVDAFDGQVSTAVVATGTGYGAGTREASEGPANLVRVQLLSEAGAEDLSRDPSVWLGAFNLDDATGEEVGFLVERLRDAGALEVWTQDVQMKKDRPGVIVNALCRRGRRSAIETVAFDNSPTLGMRWQRFERTECEREELQVELYGHSIRVKRRIRPRARRTSPAERRDVSPEFDDLAAAARATGRSLRDLEHEAQSLVLQQLRNRGR